MAQENLATQNLLEVSRVERNALVLTDGGIRAVILVSGMNFELRSEDEQNAAISAYQNFLNGLDFSIQIFIHSRKVNIDGYIAELVALERKEENKLLAELTKGYKDFVASLVSDNPIMEKRFFVVVPYDAALPQSQRAILDTIVSFFKRKRIEDPTSPDGLRGASISTTTPQTEAGPAPRFVPHSPQAAWESPQGVVGENSFIQLSQRTEQVASGLSQIGLRAVPLEEDELTELFYNLYNPETVERHVIARE